MSKTITRADLAESIFENIGISKKHSSTLVDQLFETILQTVEKGDNVKISSFGNFEVRQKRERIGRNPKTGEEVPITARKVLVFKPSNVLKNKIND